MRISIKIVLAAGDSKSNPSKLKKKRNVLVYITESCREVVLPSYLAEYFRTPSLSFCTSSLSAPFSYSLLLPMDMMVVRVATPSSLLKL